MTRKDRKIKEKEFLQKLVPYVKTLHMACHSPNCEAPEVCPRLHPSCLRSLNIHTSIMWELAELLESIKYQMGFTVGRNRAFIDKLIAMAFGLCVAMVNGLEYHPKKKSYLRIITAWKRCSSLPVPKDPLEFFDTLRVILDAELPNWA